MLYHTTARPARPHPLPDAVLPRQFEERVRQCPRVAWRHKHAAARLGQDRASFARHHQHDRPGAGHGIEHLRRDEHLEGWLRGQRHEQDVCRVHVVRARLERHLRKEADVGQAVGLRARDQGGPLRPLTDEQKLDGRAGGEQARRGIEDRPETLRQAVAGRHT